MTKFEVVRRLLERPEFQVVIGPGVRAIVQQDDEFAGLLMVAAIYIAAGGPESLRALVGSVQRLRPFVLTALDEIDPVPPALIQEAS